MTGYPMHDIARHVSGIRAPRGTRNERGMSPFRLEAGNGSAFGSWCHNHRNPRRHQ
jgi:hypothetical protein